MKRLLPWGDVAASVVFGGVIVWFCRTHWGARCWIGVAVALVGLVLWITARRQLGDSFSLAAKAKALVTTGLYARLRHPIYVFGFVTDSGIFLILGKWIPYLCFVAIYVALEGPRVALEERVLADAYGDAYRAYRGRTWF